MLSLAYDIVTFHLWCLSILLMCEHSWLRICMHVCHGTCVNDRGPLLVSDLSSNLVGKRISLLFAVTADSNASLISVSSFVIGTHWDCGHELPCTAFPWARGIPTQTLNTCAISIVPLSLKATSGFYFHLWNSPFCCYVALMLGSHLYLDII